MLHPCGLCHVHEFASASESPGGSSHWWGEKGRGTRGAVCRSFIVHSLGHARVACIWKDSIVTEGEGEANGGHAHTAYAYAYSMIRLLR